MRPLGTGVLVATIVLATLAFGIGAGLEKATASTTAPAVHQESTGTPESGGSSETAAKSSEVVFGINPESTPMIVGAVLGSAALALGVWLYWRRVAVLWVAGAAMAVFAIVDLVEVVHQVSEQHPPLILVAGIVALLHCAAAVMACRLATAGSSTAHEAAV